MTPSPVQVPGPSAPSRLALLVLALVMVAGAAIAGRAASGQDGRLGPPGPGAGPAGEARAPRDRSLGGGQSAVVSFTAPSRAVAPLDPRFADLRLSVRRVHAVRDGDDLLRLGLTVELRAARRHRAVVRWLVAGLAARDPIVGRSTLEVRAGSPGGTPGDRMLTTIGPGLHRLELWVDPHELSSLRPTRRTQRLELRIVEGKASAVLSVPLRLYRSPRRQ